MPWTPKLNWTTGDQLTGAQLNRIEQGITDATAFITLSRVGLLSAVNGNVKVPITRALTIKAVRAMVGTAPTGQAIRLDINKNGTTLYTTQANRPLINTNNFDSGVGTLPDVTTLAPGDYLTLDVDQIGSTIQGSDLGVTIEVG